MGAARASDLSLNARRTVDALAFLEQTSLSSTQVAAILNSSMDVASGVVDELVRGGWFEKDGDITAAAREQFESLGRSLAPTDVAQAVTSLATHLMAMLDSVARGDRLDSDRLDTAASTGAGVDLADAGGAAVPTGAIVAAVRGAARCGGPLLGAELASAAWRIAGQVDDDPGWWRELARAGEDTAIEAREPTLLVDLLSHSAARYAAVRDRAGAEHAWVRALAIADEASDRDRSESILTNLAELYLGWGRFHKALDVYANLAMRRQHANDPVGMAEAFAGAGLAMLQAKEPERAVAYLTQADEALTSIQSAPNESTSIETSTETSLDTSVSEIARLHGTILHHLGQALTALRSPGAAAVFSRALALLIDVDDEAADQVRTRLDEVSRARW